MDREGDAVKGRIGNIEPNDYWIDRKFLAEPASGIGAGLNNLLKIFEVDHVVGLQEFEPDAIHYFHFVIILNN